jgi:hypothetical protein
MLASVAPAPLTARAVVWFGILSLALVAAAACSRTPATTEVEVEVHMTACKATDPATCATVAVPDTMVTVRLPGGATVTEPADAAGTARFTLEGPDLDGALIAVVATSPFLSGELSGGHYLPPGGGLLTVSLADPEIATVSR